MRHITHLTSTLAISATLISAASAQEVTSLVYVSPDPLGVNAFLLMGQSGTEAAGELLGADVRTFESATAIDRQRNVEVAVDEGADIVVVLGFEFGDIVSDIAPTAPETDFLIVDQCIDNPPPNVHCALFREYEATYLVGYAAGLLTESNRVGALAALDIPFQHRYTEGFAAGAQAANESVEVDIRYVGGQNPFADPVRAKELSLSMVAAGSDVIFTATAGGDFGVFEASREEGFQLFNVDVDFCELAPETMQDAALKQVDEAILAATQRIASGEDNVIVQLGLEESGMALVALDEDRAAQSDCLLARNTDVAEQVRAVADRIMSGDLVITDPMFD